MKIGKYPVKHSYKISRLVADVLSLGLAVLIVSVTVMFFQQYNSFIEQFMLLTEEATSALRENNPNYEWKQWLALIFPALALAVFIAYIVLTCKSHKFSGYSVTKLTAQKCYDEYAFCISLLKLPALIIIINLMCVAHDKLLPAPVYGYEWFGFDTVLPIVLYGIIMAVIFRYTRHKITNITAKAKAAESDTVRLKAVVAEKLKETESGKPAPSDKEDKKA